MELSAETIAGIEHVSDLRETESHGVVRPDRRPHHFTRFAADAGGDIQAENRLGAHVDQFDHLLVNAADRPVQAGPEEGVDDPVAVDHRRSDLRDLFDAFHLDGKPLDDLPIGLCRPAESVGVPDEQDAGCPATGEDVPRHDKTVASIVSDPAENHIPPPDDTQFPGEDMK